MSEGTEPGRPGRRRRGVVVAVLVTLAAVLAGVRGDGAGAVPAAPLHRVPPRFMLTVGSGGDRGGVRGEQPWFQVRALDQAGRATLVESVPVPAAGRAHEILGGPGGVFMVVASSMAPCESRAYRFSLTGDGRVTGLAPVNGTVTPGVIGGLAASPDGRRIAYTTAPCAAVPDAAMSGPPIPEISTAAVTVLELATGGRRMWTTAEPAIVGEIVWAADSRTLGYTVSEVMPGSQTALTGGRAHVDGAYGVGTVTSYALDTAAAGTDLRAGRVLFRSPDSLHVVSSAVMAPDGRSGFGRMRTTQPPAVVLFTFTEGRPIKVVDTIPDKPNTLSALVVDTGTGPRYACLGGVDAFGRVRDGLLFTRGPVNACTVATDRPS